MLLKNERLFLEKKNLKFFLFYYKNRKFLVFQKEKNNFVNFNYILYHKIPISFAIKQVAKTFLFEEKNSTFFQDKIEGFQHSITNLTKTLNKTFKKKLILKGLGLRVFYNSKLRLLKLKLGFSFLIDIPVPTGIQVFINKNLLVLESPNSILVGNFAYYIYLLKIPNIYNGKGFWFKDQQLKLKLVKKV